MEYAAWKLFIDAAELGSLSKVAVAYGTSQPHISRRISDLEQECGGRLFQRTGRGVVLTEPAAERSVICSTSGVVAIAPAAPATVVLGQ